MVMWGYKFKLNQSSTLLNCIEGEMALRKVNNANDLAGIQNSGDG